MLDFCSRHHNPTTFFEKVVFYCFSFWSGSLNNIWATSFTLFFSQLFFLMVGSTLWHQIALFSSSQFISTPLTIAQATTAVTDPLENGQQAKSGQNIRTDSGGCVVSRNKWPDKRLNIEANMVNARVLLHTLFCFHCIPHTSYCFSNDSSNHFVLFKILPSIAHFPWS